MTYSKSGWYVQTLLMSFTQTVQTGTPTSLNFATNANDANMKLSLVSNSAADYTAPVNTASATLGVWTNTDEVTGTGWATGGVVLSTAAAGGDVNQTLTNPATTPGNLVFTWGTPLSVTGTTLTGVFGFIIYFQSVTLPLAKPELLTIYVGTGYNTVAGTFGITPSGSGLSVLTLTA
jgi:hypothetical protein